MAGADDDLVQRGRRKKNEGDYCLTLHLFENGGVADEEESGPLGVKNEKDKRTGPYAYGGKVFDETRQGGGKVWLLSG